MKRFHVHIHVADLDASRQFYSKLFGAEPVVTKHDYARWMLEDPRVNFAISAGGRPIGVNHLGFQVESPGELSALQSQLHAADPALVEQKDTTCCYARSDKYWVKDPSGIAWESFHTLETVPVFGGSERSAGDRPCCGSKGTC